MRNDVFLTAAAESLESIDLATSAVMDFTATADGEAPKRPTFRIDAYNGGQMTVAAFYRPVVIDLAGLRAGRVVVLLDHDPSQIVGQGAAKIGTSVVVTGMVTGDAADKADPAHKVVMHAKNGFVWAASVGVFVTKTEFVDAGAKALVNGQEFAGPLVIVRGGRLGEVSFVSMGADETASAKVAASAAGNAKQGERTMNFTQWLEAMGLKESELTDDAKAKLRAKFDAEQATLQAKATAEAGKTPQAPTQPAPVVQAAAGGGFAGLSPDEVVEAQVREENRKAKITALIAEAVRKPGAPLEKLREIGNTAIAQGWSVENTDVAILRAGRAQMPFVGTSSSAPPTAAVLTAGLLLACQVSDEKLAKDRDFGPVVVEAAWKRRNSGLLSLFAAALEAEGVHAPHGGQALFAAVVEHYVKAGFSTVDIAGIIGASANKLLLDSFTAVEAVYPDVAQQVDFNNFNTYTNYRLDHTGEFAKIGPDGELKHGKLAESSYTNKLDTSGQILTLTRQAVINDDLNAFQQIYRMLGRKARIAIEKALITLVMEASDVFYTSARGNRLTTNALSITGLGAAEAAMLQMVDGDGDPIYATPTMILVPPALKATGDSLYVSTNLNQTPASNVAQGQENPYRGRFRVKSSPYMALSTMTGYSATSWYMLGDPNNIPAFQVAYLQGKRQPTIETTDTEFSSLGVQNRCYFDFGIARIDYRGCVKSSA